MIALDTNVLVRLLVSDDQAQARVAAKFFDSLAPSNSGLICREVLIELVWVLERTYGFGRVEISRSLYELIDSSEIVVEDVDRVLNVLNEYQTSKNDFSDLMIRSVATTFGATHVVTFDERFARIDDVELLN